MEPIRNRPANWGREVGRRQDALDRAEGRLLVGTVAAVVLLVVLALLKG